MKEFTTALKAIEQEQDEEDATLHFSLDGHELKIYPPSDGQLALLMASTGRHRTMPNQIAGIIDFFVELMDEESAGYIERRLLDRKDPFGLTEVTAIMEWMVEEWTGRPTQSPSGSTQSRRPGGRRSTPRTSQQTSSDSQRTGS